MKLCSTVLIVGAVVVALFAVVFQCLNEQLRFDVITVTLYPLFRVLWSTGIAIQLIFPRIDHTNFTQPRPIAQDTAWLDVIKSWKPVEQDFVVATFPKSGTHLMMQMATQIASNASEVTADFESIHELVVGVEMISRSLLEAAGDKISLSLENYKERSILQPWLHVTHLDREHAPIGPAARYVVIARDPADVLVSLHSQLTKMMGRLAPTKDEGLGLLQWICGGWAEWNRDWWFHHKKHSDKVLWLFYEDILKDMPGTIARVTRFMGKAEDPEVMARVAARTDIKYMKLKANAFEPPHAMNFLPVQAPSGTNMINKGKSGRAQELSEATREGIRSYCRRVLGDVGFPLAKFPSC